MPLSPLQSWELIGAIIGAVGLLVAFALARAARLQDDLSEEVLRGEIHDENLASISRSWYH